MPQTVPAESVIVPLCPIVSSVCRGSASTATHPDPDRCHQSDGTSAVCAKTVWFLYSRSATFGIVESATPPGAASMFGAVPTRVQVTPDPSTMLPDVVVSVVPSADSVGCVARGSVVATQPDPFQMNHDEVELS